MNLFMEKLIKQVNIKYMHIITTNSYDHYDKPV